MKTFLSYAALVVWIVIMLLITPSLLCAATYNDIHGITIEGETLTNDVGPCLRITNASDIVIRDMTIGPCAGNGIELENVSRITIADSYIIDAAGLIYALNSERITVKNNRLINPRGPLPRGQAVQLNRTHHSVIKHNIINCNACGMEDAINAFKSSYNNIEHNSITGGSAPTGCGILIGDHGGNGNTVQHNVLRDSGSCGIGVAGGEHNIVEHNDVRSARHDFSNIGIYVWANNNPIACAHNSVNNNTVDWTHANGHSNPIWTSTSCSNTQRLNN